MQVIDSMEKGLTWQELDVFVTVPERPRIELWDLNNPGWSVNKSKQNRFVITPNGYGLSIFTTLPLLTFGTILTLIGIMFILLSIAIRVILQFSDCADNRDITSNFMSTCQKK